jgi:hypothetical protein
MKTPSLLTLLLTFAITAPLLHAQLSGSDHVRIEARVQTEQDRKANKGTTVDTVTQSKTLQLTLTGKPKSPETRKGTWTVYARDVKSNKIIVAESGEFPIDFGAGPQKLESKKVNMTYTPERSSGGGGKGRGGGGRGGSSKKTPAEGTKYAGYGVTVKDGDKTVGEHFDPAGLKAEAAK